jgi:Ran GTPase-activating protein (RanGAP) involved in mRNA processing and transport
MMALLKAFQANASTLREVYIHDNWVKGEAVDQLIKFLLKAEVLEKLNVSDSDMGNEKVYLLFKAIEASASRTVIKELYCNFNEVTSSKYSDAIIQTALVQMTGLALFEFKGNCVLKKVAAGLMTKFEELGKKALFHEVTSDDEGDDEDEEEEDEEED